MHPGIKPGSMWRQIHQLQDLQKWKTRPLKCLQKFFFDLGAKQFWDWLLPGFAAVILCSSGDLNSPEQDENPEVNNKVKRTPPHPVLPGGALLSHYPIKSAIGSQGTDR